MDKEKAKIHSLSIIRFMELFGFFLAFSLLYILFIRLNLDNYKIAILAFVISLCVIKTDLLFYIINNLRDIGSRIFKIITFPFRFAYSVILGICRAIHHGRIIEIYRKIIEVFWKYLTVTAVKKTIKYFVVVFKQLFFNTSYDLFPIFLIWLIIWGVGYISNLVSIPNTSTLITFITAFTIVLAIFQFFLQRHEEKIFAKISQFPRRIESIIIEETTFTKFFLSIDNSSLKEKIKLFVDPKLSALDLLNRAFKDTLLRDWYNDMRRTHSPMPIQLILNQSYDSEQRYLITESYLETGDKQDLYKAYSKFFLQDAYEIILDRIEEEIDIEEFAILAQSNINIIQEVLPDFVNRQLQKEFEKLTFGKGEKLEIIPEASHQEYREFMKMRIIEGLQQKILS